MLKEGVLRRGSIKIISFAEQVWTDELETVLKVMCGGSHYLKFHVKGTILQKHSNDTVVSITSELRDSASRLPDDETVT